MDEPRSVSLVWPRCPLCGCNVRLWRLVTKFEQTLGSKRIAFQVRCGADPLLKCPQRPVPEHPVDDGKQAVQAWKMYVLLSTGQT